MGRYLPQPKWTRAKWLKYFCPIVQTLLLENPEGKLLLSYDLRKIEIDRDCATTATLEPIKLFNQLDSLKLYCHGPYPDPTFLSEHYFHFLEGQLRNVFSHILGRQILGWPKSGGGGPRLVRMAKGWVKIIKSGDIPELQTFGHYDASKCSPPCQGKRITWRWSPSKKQFVIRKAIPQMIDDWVKIR